MKTQSISDFLTGGGEMGELIRSKDWSKTALGPIEIWPTSLKTTLGIIVHSKFPMFLFWGPELICFYNDAYRPSLGNDGKHPGILGNPGKEAWPEIWVIIKPLIDQVLGGGEATWSEDQLIPIYRNKELQDVYWTFSYSPAYDESANIAGVFVTCFETTKKVHDVDEIRKSEDQLNFTLDAAELATWDLNPATNKFVGNNRIKEWFGLNPDDEIPLSLALDRIDESDRARVTKAIQYALTPESHGAYEIEYFINNPLTGISRHVFAKGKALFDKNNVAYRFSGTLQDITQNRLLRRKAENVEKLFRSTVDQAPLGITIFRGPEFIVEMANQTYLQIVDRDKETFEGRSLFDSLPEVRSAVEPLLTSVLKTGVPYYGNEFPVILNRYGNKDLTYFDFVYHPLRNENGVIDGIIVVATEVTKSVNARHALSESEKQFRVMVMQSPIPMTIFRGENHIIEMANETMFRDVWKKKESEIVGRPALEVFPELNDQKYPALLKEVFTTGKTHREIESLAYVKGDDGMHKYYLDFEYAPLYDTDQKISGIIITVNNVTEKVEARVKVEEAEQRLRLAAEATGFSTWELDLQNPKIIHSPRLAEIFGHDQNKILTHIEMRAQVIPDDRRNIVEKAFETAMTSGIYAYEARILRPDNTIGWIQTRGIVYYDSDKKPLKIIGTLRDITEEKTHRQILEESEEKFRLLSDSMPQLVWTSDPNGKLNYFNKSMFTYTGLTHEQIILNGWLDLIHPHDRLETIKQWMDSIVSGDEFLYEHRFRNFKGEYRWHLSRATPQRDTEGKIQMWVATSTDIEDQKVFTRELERQVMERTGQLESKNRELEKMNSELQSFAYVSSHDLQEPLRKIRTFASHILEKEEKQLSDNAKDYFKRMQAAAKRMQTLIEDLLTYSRTSTNEKNFEKTDLNKILDQVKSDLKEDIQQKQAVIDSGDLLEIKVIPFQIRQLIHNLIGNSLKFSKENVTSHIRISAEIIKGSTIDLDGISPEKRYYHLSITDNGIGFDPQYQQKIFEVFQRLHGRDEYKGTGIGLAIVKKIVENHQGVIHATGKQNEGATFDIYFPINSADTPFLNSI